MESMNLDNVAVRASYINSLRSFIQSQRKMLIQLIQDGARGDVLMEYATRIMVAEAKIAGASESV